jgi:hypothetical protein
VFSFAEKVQASHKAVEGDGMDDVELCNGFEAEDNTVRLLEYTREV